MDIMYIRFFQIFFICSIYVFASECTDQKFIDSGIVPNIVPDIPKLIKVFYEGIEIELGAEVNRSLVKYAPMIEYDANDDDMYAVFMIDPDAPTPQNPVLAQYLHGLMENIPGNKTKNGHIHSRYVQPSPPPGSDPHRYAVLLYKQTEVVPDTMYLGGKTHFNISQYTSSRNFQGPTAGFFFYVRPDKTSVCS